jgi:hypothetical protein
MTTTLMPEAPGTWIEAIHLAFPDAMLEQEDGLATLILPLDDRMEIEFNRGDDALGDIWYTAWMKEYAPDHGLDRETPLAEETYVDDLIKVMLVWLEDYFEMSTQLEALISMAEHYEGEGS